MTREDYSTIKRQLGFIEGIVTNTENVVYDGVVGAIEIIEEIIDGEKVGEDK